MYEDWVKLQSDRSGRKSGNEGMDDEDAVEWLLSWRLLFAVVFALSNMESSSLPQTFVRFRVPSLRAESTSFVSGGNGKLLGFCLDEVNLGL